METRNVCKFFRRGSPREVRSVDDVSIQIPHGAFAALTGPSGSGKTTLLSLLGLLDRPTSGAVIIEGRNYSRCSDYELTRFRRRVGFVFQDYGLLPRLNVIDNVTYPLIPRGGDPKQRRRVVQAIVERLGLSQQSTSRPEELSGGEGQRTALARALAGAPEILMADEPTSNLDRDSSRNVLEVLCEMHAADKTLVLSTHDEALLALATHIFQLRGGKLVQAP